MPSIKTRIRVSPDGTLSGHAAGVPPGEHDAEIILLPGNAKSEKGEWQNLLTRVRAIQAEFARLPVIDSRRADEIIGYNERGYVD